MIQCPYTWYLRVSASYLLGYQVQLQQKIKQEAEQFRQWKFSREKELLQVHPPLTLYFS